MNGSRIAYFRQRCTWLDDAKPIPYELAEGFVAVSDRWRKRDGTVVESPGMAKHVLRLANGWGIEYGANTLHVEDAIRRAARLIRRAYDDLLAGGAPDGRLLERAIQSEFSSCVSHRTSGRYARYPLDGNDLVFGVHYIDTRVAARFLISESGLREAAPLNRRRRKTVALGEPASGQKLSKKAPTSTNAALRRATREPTKTPLTPQKPSAAASTIPPRKPPALLVNDAKKQALSRARKMFVTTKYEEIKKEFPVLKDSPDLRQKVRAVLKRYIFESGPDGDDIPSDVAHEVRALRKELEERSSKRKSTPQTGQACSRTQSRAPRRGGENQ